MSFTRWAWTLALLLPVGVLYACEYLGAGPDRFTGFIQYDQPYYMANAEKIFHGGGFPFLYANPFSPDPATPRIYFQLHLFVLGLVQAVTGWDPGVLYVIFGAAAGLACARVAIALYEEVAGLRSPAQVTGLVLFLWGGGLLTLAGMVAHLLNHGLRGPWVDLFLYDPASGWWLLNLGRNLVLPTEAYYHALALGLILALIRRNYRVALWAITALALSHPFTGLEFLLIVLAWCLLEKVVIGHSDIPRPFPLMLAVLLIFHIGYNVFLLNLFPEHRSVFRQWSLNWPEPALSSILADGLVGFFALTALFRSKPTAAFFSTRTNRLLATWFVVSLVLVHHDLVVPPVQPLHFSRGYTWIPLFLLGARPLVELLEKGYARKTRMLQLAAVSAILLVGLSDNAAWLGFHIVHALRGNDTDVFRSSTSQRELYQALMTRPAPHTEILITPDIGSPVVYLAMTYTDYRAWFSHFACTPFADERYLEQIVYFQEGKFPDGWHGRTFLIIVPRNFSAPLDKTPVTGPIVFENHDYVVRSLAVP